VEERLLFNRVNISGNGGTVDVGVQFPLAVLANLAFVHFILVNHATMRAAISDHEAIAGYEDARPGGVSSPPAACQSFDTDHGLLVPVIRDIACKCIEQIATKLRDFTDAARRRQISQDAVEDGTFTVSNQESVK
jgi:hypothetical protein